MKKILLIDDDPDLTRLLSRIIKSCKESEFEFNYASNGQEAITSIKEALDKNGNHYDAIFCDIKMPVMTGLEFLKEFHKLESVQKNIPVIMCTAYKDSEKWSKILEDDSHRIAFYIKKPFDVDQIRKIVSELIILKRLDTYRDTTELFGKVFLENHRNDVKDARDYIFKEEDDLELEKSMRDFDITDNEWN
jgi:CheY-like chemotaxis protein